MIPFWADEPEEGIINARSETADEKRLFESAWESRPCPVLSSGFYEWKSQNGGQKQPYRIHREEGPAFGMAGLWDIWVGEEATISCITILTTDPNNLMARFTTGCRSSCRKTPNPSGSLPGQTSAKSCVSRTRRMI